ncbi:class I SAM-dependent methyltransferase [Coraliomargarita parva]|uniref:class I SAM-dependent methyltransferase n=1 Tax=Coraliomargarita parva TaxID=3014050 RepID=UPI0022B366F8|nr:class I SAM-dependent methyltransferase [Coraliomargarita parva]
MERETVLAYFDSDVVVDHYALAAARVGLWESEEKIFTRLFQQADSILELGCGAGRIAFGLHELGYRNILATDYSRQMVKQARHMAEVLEYAIPMQVADATRLPFEDNLFDGAIFGFNGLMQIPKAENREKALREIFRVIRPGAWFVFTSHDRENPKHRKFWEQEKLRWRRSKQKEALDDFGDRYEPTDMGELYIHVPTIREMEKVLKGVGFRIEANAMRSAVANESPRVREFSDDCRFWVVQKPEV